MSKRILIGISTYNDVEHLGMLLQSIDWYTYMSQSEYQVVVCDDGSRPEMVEAERALCERFGVVFIENGFNQGIPATWNHLADSCGADSEIIVILNNDLLAVPYMFETMDHFLTANKGNPQLGSAFWQPYQPFTKEVMKTILPNLGHTLYTSQDLVTGKQNESNHPESWGIARFDSKEQDGHGIGRVMCPIGCCFAFTREVWNKVGKFDERLTSFHEESDWGTRCASMGMASFALPYPKPYHAHGFTFGENAELNPSDRMRASRKLYREIWSVPGNIGPNEYFNYVNGQLMPQIPLTELRYLSPDYTEPPAEVILRGGEKMRLPKLVEKVGMY